MIIIIINHGFLNDLLEFHVDKSPIQSFIPTTLEEGTKAHCTYNIRSI